MADAARRVLIVDDHRQIVDLLRQYFAQQYATSGLVIETADNGPGAIAAVRASRPALVLLDVEMPGLSGVEVLRQIRAFDPRIPVIMITGSESFSVAGQIMEHGAFAYLQKPVNFTYLDHMVSSVFGKPDQPRR